MLETIIGISFWVIIFLVWYARSYPDRMPDFLRSGSRKPDSSLKKAPQISQTVKTSREYKKLVEIVETVCARDRFGSSDAASMVHALKKLIQIEKSSGQIWEAYALDALETAEIICDDCKRPVTKTTSKSGVRIQCDHCNQWLELKNSKVAILDFPKKGAGTH